jgi:hypothetical protein
MIQTLKIFIPLTVVFSVLVATNFLYAAWTPPGNSPPSSNVPAPINVGSSAQDKAGVLGVGGLSVFGNTLIHSAAPTIELSDSNHNDWWIRADGNRVYFLADRDDNGTWSGESPWPLVMQAGATSAEDYALFSSQVRATEYCNRGGTVCFTSEDASGGGSLDVAENALRADAVGWNGSSNSGGINFNQPSTDSDSSGYQVCFLATNITIMTNDSQYNGGGGCALTHTGDTWSLNARADKRMSTQCVASCLR